MFMHPRHMTVTSMLALSSMALPKIETSYGYKVSWFFNLASCKVVRASVLCDTGNALIINSIGSIVAN